MVLPNTHVIVCEVTLSKSISWTFTRPGGVILHFQIHTDTDPAPSPSRWVLVLLVFTSSTERNIKYGVWIFIALTASESRWTNQ